MSTQNDLILVKTKNRVATLTMNNPRRLNGWTVDMQAALRDALSAAAAAEDVQAVVLTGTGEYYSAGADLSGSLRFDLPRKTHQLIERQNYRLFDAFLQFPKPILAAVNGAALGAPVTSATLCDAILASDRASFRTPFARFGLPPEGCSSIHFERLIGAEAAERILGAEGWRPDANEALAIGLINEVIPHERLNERAQAIAEGWVADEKIRSFRGGSTKEELVETNRKESKGIADAFLSARFLMSQYRFLRSKKKTTPALTFLALRMTRPAWALLL
ncbi:MAG: enoyl-CoA hydratase/isomerase family protein [Myxococcota bacterium]